MVSLGIFSVVPPTEPCVLRSTQPLKVRTRDFSWGKGGRCVSLTTYHPCSAETSRKSGALTYPEPLRPPRPVVGHLYFYFTFIYIHTYTSIYIYVCVYIHMCVYIYTYIYIHTHIYIYIYINRHQITSGGKNSNNLKNKLVARDILQSIQW